MMIEDMEDSMEMENMPMPETPKGGDTQRVPIEALGIDEDGGQVANPEVGDAVNYRVDGKVEAIDGGMVIVRIESVNGVSPQSAAPEPPGPDSLTALRRDAQRMGAL